MRNHPLLLIASLLLIAGAALLTSQAPPPERVGPLAGGGFLLNSGWRVAPVGTQVPLDTFPMSCALSRDGRYLLVLNGGYNPPSISVIEVSSARELSRTRVADGWLGLTFSPAAEPIVSVQLLHVRRLPRSDLSQDRR